MDIKKKMQGVAANLVGGLTGEVVVPGAEPPKDRATPPPKRKREPAPPAPAIEEPAGDFDTEITHVPDFGHPDEIEQPQTGTEQDAEPEKGDDDTILPVPRDPDSYEDGEDDTEEGEDGPKKPPLKVLIIGGVVLAVILVGFLIISAIGSGARSKIDIMPMVDIKLEERVNGYGRIRASVNEQKLMQAISEAKIPLPRDVTATDAARDIAQMTQISLSKEDGLTNGDTVDIFVDVDQTAVSNSYPGFRINGGKGIWTASELVDGTYIDPFADTAISLRVEGNSGSASAYLDVLGKGAYIYYLNYDWTPKKNLKNGDTVTVTVSPMDAKLSELGYAISGKRSREFVVGGLNEIVTDPKDIPDAYLNSMVSYAESELAKAYTAVPFQEGEDIIVTAPEITSIYFLDKADKTTAYSDWFSGLQMSNGVAVLGHFFVQDIEPVETKAEDGTVTTSNEVANTYGGYYVWIFPDMVKRPGGDYGYNQNMITQRTTSYQTENECVSWLKGEFSGFAVTKIGSNPAA